MLAQLNWIIQSKYSLHSWKRKWFLLIPCLGLTSWMSLSENFILNDSTSNGMDVVDDTLLLSVFFTFPHEHFVTGIWPVINAFLTNKMKQTSSSIVMRYFNIGFSAKCSMTKKLSYMSHHIMMTKIHSKKSLSQIPWFGLSSTYSMQCLETLVKMQCAIVHHCYQHATDKLTLSILHVMNASRLRLFCPWTWSAHW